MTEDKQTLLAAVADRPAADLIAALDRSLERLQERVTALEGASAAQPDEGFPDGPDGLAVTLSGKVAAALVAAGYGSVAAVRAASDADLLAAGIDAKTLKFIRSKVAGDPVFGNRNKGE